MSYPSSTSISAVLLFSLNIGYRPVFFGWCVVTASIGFGGLFSSFSLSSTINPMSWWCFSGRSLFFPLIYQSDFLSFSYLYMKVPLPYPGSLHLMRCFWLQATGRAFLFSCLPCLFFSDFFRSFHEGASALPGYTPHVLPSGLRQLVCFPRVSRSSSSGGPQVSLSTSFP